MNEHTTAARIASALERIAAAQEESIAITKTLAELQREMVAMQRLLLRAQLGEDIGLEYPRQ